MPSMKRFTTLLARTKSQHGDFDNAPLDSPEANAGRAARLFCESGSPDNRDEEVLHLPVIVEAAESSPQAAAAACLQIRKFLTKDYAARPHVQYNACMLVRILCDNPGPTFMRCMDKAFVATVKDCLRQCRDASVQQILRETLDHLEVEKGYEESIQPLLAMWRKEKGGQASLMQRQPQARGQLGPASGNDGAAGGWSQSRRHSSLRTDQRTLPPPQELASRVEEARNTAKILLQLIQSTPQHEVLGNDLIAEFSDRCQSAQRSMQSYINCNSPAPDDDTMLTLIETNEQLSLASSRHQRVLLSARRALGASTSPAERASPNVSTATSAQRERVAQSRSPDLGANTMAFGGKPSQTSYETYQPPPGPPPSMMNRLTSRDGNSNFSPSPVPAPAQHSNPFRDPGEYQANVSPFASPQQRFSALATDTTAPSSTYSSMRSEMPRRDTYALENAYAIYRDDRPSPTISSPSETHESGSYSTTLNTVDTSGSTRPNPGPWDYNGMTSSSFGRSADSASGPVMHGAQGYHRVSEIDTNSQVGRSNRVDVPAAAGAPRSRDGNESMYSISPVNTRAYP